MCAVLLLQGVNPIAVKYTYTGCPRRNETDIGRVFLEINYTDVTKKTYKQSRTLVDIYGQRILKV
jgi:hypothetical protein